MNRRHFVSSAAAFALGTRAADAASSTPAPSLQFQTSIRERLQTRAEISSYAETSSNADVEAFIGNLDRRGAPMMRGSLGFSALGHEIPYLVTSRPVLLDAPAARAARKPVVFVIANGRATEPDGKEAALAVVRDLSLASGHTILEDIVLVVVPNLNVDANASAQPAATVAPDLNGPVTVGARLDGAGVDLERDFLALRSHAVAQLVDLIKYWDPDVFVDLRTGSSSLSSFALTYASSLNPAAFYAGPYARDTMLPVIRKQLKDKFGIEAFTAGGFGNATPLRYPLPGNELGWYAPSDSAEDPANYLGIRGTTAVVGYAFSHDSFERRVFYLRAFLSTVLQYCSDKSDELLSRRRLASHWTTGSIPLRTARDPHPSGQELISWQIPELDDTPKDHQLGMPLGSKLSGRFSTSLTPIFDRYAGTKYAQQPHAYSVDVTRAPLARQLLARHGIRFDVRTASGASTGETFVPARVDHLTGPGGLRSTVTSGTWTTGSVPLPKGSLFVLGEQPLGPLLSLLLEPESESGLVTLGAFDATLAVGVPHVVRRVSGA